MNSIENGDHIQLIGLRLCNKVSRFDSRYWNPRCETVDTFTADWSNEKNWIVPPVYLVPRVLSHMRRSYVSRIEGGLFGVSDLKFSMLALKMDYSK